jgi:hypothetical protein
MLWTAKGKTTFGSPFCAEMVPRGGLSPLPLNRSKINYLTPPQIAALYQANVPMSTIKYWPISAADFSNAANEFTQVPAVAVENSSAPSLSLAPKFGCQYGTTYSSTLTQLIQLEFVQTHFIKLPMSLSILPS